MDMCSLLLAGSRGFGLPRVVARAETLRHEHSDDSWCDDGERRRTAAESTGRRSRLWRYLAKEHTADQVSTDIMAVTRHLRVLPSCNLPVTWILFLASLGTFRVDIASPFTTILPRKSTVTFPSKSGLLFIWMTPSSTTSTSSETQDVVVDVSCLCRIDSVAYGRWRGTRGRWRGRRV